MQKIYVKPKDYWMNDPNGFIYYKGMYHLFYQCFPYGPRWGRMHWGHVVSKDLVNWEEQGIALFPSKTDDRSGCFSGSAIEEDGKMQLYYTGVNYLTENPEDINLCVDEHFVSAQLMITSEDGIHFDNIKDKKTVIPVIHDADIGDARHTRDPKVWKDGDRWYMVLGSTINDKQGKLLFFTSTDGEEWKFENSVTRENFGWMWECPDYFEVDNSQVVIFSPMQLFKDGKAEDAQTVCMQVTFDKETCDMKLPEKYQFLDYGTDLYAPQSTLDESGRRILTAWLRMPEPVDGKWQGMMCIPRIVEVQKDHIYFRVHPNVQAVYTKEISEPSEADESGYRLRFSLEDGDKVNVGGYVIFTFVAIYTVERLGRRALMLLGAGGLAGIYLVLGTCYFFQVSGFFMVVLVVLAIACYAMSLGPITWVLLAEIFPNRVRGVAMATCTFALWVGSFTLTYTFPLLNTALGSYGTFWIYSAICVFGFLFFLRALPETKGKSLETLEKDLIK